MAILGLRGPGPNQEPKATWKGLSRRPCCTGPVGPGARDAWMGGTYPVALLSRKSSQAVEATVTLREDRGLLRDCPTHNDGPLSLGPRTLRVAAASPPATTHSTVLGLSSRPPLPETRTKAQREGGPRAADRGPEAPRPAVPG